MNIHGLATLTLRSLLAVVATLCRGSMTVKRPVYVVFPAALLDGWEVVKEPSDQSVHFGSRETAVAYARAQAEADGGGSVRLENWYGDLESALEVRPRIDSRRLSAACGRHP